MHTIVQRGSVTVEYKKKKMRSSVVLLLLLLKTLTFSCAQVDNRRELRVAFITSFGGEYDSSVAVPAVRLAASKINENQTLLVDYKLVVELVENITVAKTSANSKVSLCFSPLGHAYIPLMQSHKLSYSGQL